MITVSQIRDGQAYMRNHLSSNDYYSESESVVGYWHGKAAESLGLEGKAVTSEAFEALRTNRHPQTGDKLTPRKPKVAYHDFVISAPKSVSVVAMVGEDQRVIEAFDRCVEKVFERLESEACIRVREGSQVHTEAVRKTGNAVAALYRHNTSRLLDPQLHTHMVFANVTWDDESQRWLALQPRGMAEESQEIRKQFYQDLESECRGLGYRTEPDGEGFRLRDLNPSLEKTFSQRTLQRDQFEDRYQKLFGEAPSKRRVEQFIKDRKGAATQRFREEYFGHFSKQPTREELTQFVVDWRSSKMSKAESQEVREKQQAAMSVAQKNELASIVKEAKNIEHVKGSELLEEKKIKDYDHKAELNSKRGIGRGEKVPSPKKETTGSNSQARKRILQAKRIGSLGAAVHASPSRLMAIRLQQLARKKAKQQDGPKRRT